MEKRSAARELAFLALFQLPQNPEKFASKLSKMDFHAICLSGIRTLADHARLNLNKAEAFFIKTERALMEYQINHPLNEPLEQGTRSVPLPQSGDFLDRIDDCYQAIALLKESLQIPEIYWHYNDIDIQDFTLTLLDQFNNKREEVDNLIKEVSKSWNINRMYKVDKLIIELAISEIISADIDPKVVISEALKIASKYSTDDGAKFINGILGDVLKHVQV